MIDFSDMDKKEINFFTRLIESAYEIEQAGDVFHVVLPHAYGNAHLGAYDKGKKEFFATRPVSGTTPQSSARRQTIRIAEESGIRYVI